jgi:AraC family transcriptional activator of mtrCDE
MDMDLLDQLLNMGPIDGYLDVRCEMRGSWALDNEPNLNHEMLYHVLLSGSATVESIGQAPTTLNPGDVLLLPTGPAHRILDRPSALGAHSASAHAKPGLRVTDGEGTTLLCGRIILTQAAWRLYCALLPSSVVVRTAQGGAATVGSRLRRIIGVMQEETDEVLPGNTAILRHLSAALFGLTLRAVVMSKEPPPGMLALAAQPRLRDLALAVMASPQRSWTLEDMARVTSMSRSTLIRKFTAAAGMAPADFVTRLRIAEASRLLKATEVSVAAAGEAVGYASEAAFQRAFKRATGVTPAAWRSTPHTVVTRPEGVQHLRIGAAP